jgi:hypothetical protein
MDGWNGHVCTNPAANTYCVGQHSYPGGMISEQRDLSWETHKDVTGKCCTQLGEKIPPCIYSANAFGKKALTAYSDPPKFFKDDTKQKRWPLPQATVCVWPYEEMYGDDVKDGRGYDYEKRLAKAVEFFKKLEMNKSLVFYYSNYSNPLNQGDERRYAVVGLSRVKLLGDIPYYEGCSDRVREAYAGGFIWQRNVTSHYPDQGLRLPYHLYLDKPEQLKQFAFFPDNPRNFKFATRHISDDDALDLVERFLEIAGTLRDMGDKSEDWPTRITWLQSLIAELWKGRGLYPGLPKILDFLGMGDGVPFLKKAVLAGKEKETKAQLFDFLDGNLKAIPGLSLSAGADKKISRQWKLKSDGERRLLKDVLPRFDLETDQVERILSDERMDWSIRSGLEDIAENPYVLSEQFVGDGPDDGISFSKIDHGVFPSPDLGGEPLADKDDGKRLRAACVDHLRHEAKHTFLSAAQVIHGVNHRLSFLPEWKSHQFTERYLDVDADLMAEALVQRAEDGKKYLYLKQTHEDESEVSSKLRVLAGIPDIKLKSPVTAAHWRDYLFDENSTLALKNREAYEKAIAGQIAACERVFVRPLCVLSGEAGTGKTRVIKAIIQAIQKAHGSGTSIQLLAPTGKAADRIREATESLNVSVPTSTVHSFLASGGWLNENMTFKRSGGSRKDGITTYIIDEASMLDLGLMAALFRAIQWNSVQRFILVGDPNQLPPIGIGRAFADVIDWLDYERPESVVMLETNIRQMENRLNDEGTGILDLAELYIRPKRGAGKDQAAKFESEEMLRRVQDPGPDGTVDKDLRVLYWKDAAELKEKLVSAIVRDMEAVTGQKLDAKRPFDLWRAGFTDKEGVQRPQCQQVLSPYRGDEFGTDGLNVHLQAHVRGKAPEFNQQVGGIALFDKVIQIRNRPKSDRIWAYNAETKALEQVEVYNGELGFVKPHGFDGQKWKWSGFNLEKFQVVFSRKRKHWVGYGSFLGKDANDRWIKEEKVDENLELGYAISVHKAQGSEFERVYFVVPKTKATLLSPEMFYTGLTRARKHCTVLIEQDISPLLQMHRLESSHLARINSSLFSFHAVPPELEDLSSWYEEGKIHRTLADDMVRSKSEVIISNMLFDRDIAFKYEVPLYASDGTFYLPDFTINWRGEEWYWEHLGRMDLDKYRNHWATKRAWYEKFFPNRLLITEESTNLSKDAAAIIANTFV